MCLCQHSRDGYILSLKKNGRRHNCLHSVILDMKLRTKIKNVKGKTNASNINSWKKSKFLLGLWFVSLGFRLLNYCHLTSDTCKLGHPWSPTFSSSSCPGLLYSEILSLSIFRNFKRLDFGWLFFFFKSSQETLYFIFIPWHFTRMSRNSDD